MKRRWQQKLSSILPLAMMVIGKNSWVESTAEWEKNVNHLVKSRVRRSLEDASSSSSSSSSSNSAYDITQFSVRFDRCQKVKMYDDELAQSGSSDTILSSMRFVLFRLCPSDSCVSCDQVYGRYILPMDDYLQYTVKYQKQEFEAMCNYCRETCNKYDNEYCSGCAKLCYHFDNLENLGYVDASNYIQCQALEIETNDDANKNDDSSQLYIGPTCSSDGSKIVIGLFTDQYCLSPSTDHDVESALGAKLSYDLLANSHTSDGSTCLSCKEPEEDEKKNKNDKEDGDAVNEMCENLYLTAGKCEAESGLASGFMQTNRNNNNNNNNNNNGKNNKNGNAKLAQNETEVCTYIHSMIWNSYTASGDINYQAKQDEVIRVLMPLQRAVLCGLSVVTTILILYALYLYRYIEQQTATAKVDLSSQGDHHLT